ncbi:UNVERIFIED_CONTAM: hypothetical protein FKN15_011153 [Acipenser sinensis]
MMASNCQPVMPIGKAKRCSRAEKKVIEVDKPQVIRYYNKYMGGVDRMDQNISYYRISIRSKKWWVPFFMFMPDVAIQNAWLLYRNSAGHKNRSLGLLAFQREVVNVYRLKFSAEVRNAPGIGRPLTAGRQRKEKVPKAVQRDEQVDLQKRISARNGKQSLKVAEDYITDPDNVEARYINKSKGRGAKANIAKGSFILEYRGTLMSKEEADKKTKNGQLFYIYAYFFNLKGNNLCDPTVCLAIARFQPPSDDVEKAPDFTDEENISSGEEYVPNSESDTESDCSYVSNYENMCNTLKKTSTEDNMQKYARAVETVKDSHPDLCTESGDSLDLGDMYCSSLEKTTEENLTKDSMKVEMEPMASEHAGTSKVHSSLSTNSSKKNYCCVCRKPQSKITRHFKVHEKKEVDIAKALSFPKGSKERQKRLEKLRNKSNFLHNSDVLSNGEGSLKVKRRPKNPPDSKKYEHCAYCRGLFVREELWRHVRRCKFVCKPDSNTEQIGRTRVLCVATTAVYILSESV